MSQRPGGAGGCGCPTGTREAPECCRLLPPPLLPHCSYPSERLLPRPPRVSRVCGPSPWPLCSGFYRDQDGRQLEPGTLCLASARASWLGLPHLPLSWLLSQKCLALGCHCLLLTRRDQGSNVGTSSVFKFWQRHRCISHALCFPICTHTRVWDPS